MAIIRTDVIDGPRVQTDGWRFGTVECEFDDARVVTREINASDESDWNAKLTAIPSQVQAEQEQIDADSASETDDEIADAEPGQATREQLAIAYLRNAYAQDTAYAAYLKFLKFDTYRQLRGWTWPQVFAALEPFGLTESEWGRYEQAYTYLNQPARIATMQDYQPIHDNWENRE